MLPPPAPIPVTTHTLWHTTHTLLRRMWWPCPPPSLRLPLPLRSIHATHTTYTRSRVCSQEPRIDGGKFGRVVYTVWLCDEVTPHHIRCLTRNGSYAVNAQWLRTHPHVWWEEEGESEEGEEGEDEEGLTNDLPVVGSPSPLPLPCCPVHTSLCADAALAFGFVFASQAAPTLR